MTQYDRGGGEGPDEAKIVWRNKLSAPYSADTVSYKYIFEYCVNGRFHLNPISHGSTCDLHFIFNLHWNVNPNRRENDLMKQTSIMIISSMII